MQGKNFTKGDRQTTEGGEDDNVANFDLFALDGDLNNRRLFSEQTIDGRTSDVHHQSRLGLAQEPPSALGTLKLARDNTLTSIGPDNEN